MRVPGCKKRDWLILQDHLPACGSREGLEPHLAAGKAAAHLDGPRPYRAQGA